MVNPFYVDPTAGHDPNAMARVGQSLKGLGAVLGERREQTVALESQKQMQTDMQTAMQSGDPAKVADFMRKNPEQADIVKQSMDAEGEMVQKDATGFLSDILTTPEDQWLPKLKQRIDTVEARGGDPKHSLKLIEAFGNNPKGAKKIAETLLAMTDQDAFDQYKTATGGVSEADIGAASPKDFTVESLSAYSESGNIGDLVRYKPKTIKVGGVEFQQNSETQKWEPIIDASDPNVSDQAAKLAEIEADKQSRLTFSKDKSKFQKGQSKALASIDSARSKAEILGNTAKEIKSLMSGWSTKYGASLKGIPGTDARKLAGLINTLRANSAFSTLSDLKQSGGTLGAISAPELVLLESALGQLDQGGDNAEQVRVIDQILKANDDSISRLENAYQMDKQRYSGSYDESQQVDQETQPTDAAVSTDQQALDWAQANPNDPRAAKILELQGK